MLMKELKTAVPIGAALALYFYLKPEISIWPSFLFFVVWISFFYLDVKITISNTHLMSHEKNLIFPSIHRRFGDVSPIIQCFIEITLIMLIVFVFEQGISVSSLSVVFFMFGIAHLDAYLSNRRVLKNRLH